MVGDGYLGAPPPFELQGLNNKLSSTLPQNLFAYTGLAGVTQPCAQGTEISKPSLHIGLLHRRIIVQQGIRVIVHQMRKNLYCFNIELILK
jgi:hypothetical protein